MKTKFLELEMKPGKDGVNLEDVRAKMHAAINENVPEKARESARKQADELVAELLRDGPMALSARTIIVAITSALESLDGLPRAVRGIAQSLDTPSHIFELGGAQSEIVAAMGFLEMAKTSLEEYLACGHCKPSTKPEEPKGPLS